MRLPLWASATCSIAHSDMLASEGVVTETDGASLLMTLSQSTKINGWSMTSSLAADSEPSDPVRFVLSYAKAADSSYSLADCLLGNGWRTEEQVVAMRYVKPSRYVSYRGVSTPYGVATISRLLKITHLFRKRAL